MPVISISFNRFLCTLGIAAGLLGTANAQLPALSDSDYQWLGQQIYANECNSKYECLTSWNEGEDFPSLGIGHFIWFKSGQIEPFEETFPALVRYLEAHQVDLPGWISEQDSLDAPWQDRDSFQRDLNSNRMSELREFLYNTRRHQSAFIAQRLKDTLPLLLAATPTKDQLALEQNFYGVANSEPPYGLYGLIDYVHFKGSGVNPKERYKDQGWGLLQVLQTMDRSGDLNAFVAAADAVLTKRVDNAPTARNESRWLAGWRNRLQTYLRN